MTRDEILRLADRLVRPALPEPDVEEIDVREEEDWSETPSIYVDVFVTADAPRPGAAAWTHVLRSFSDALVAAGESRFPYIRLRDRRVESEDIPQEAA